MNRPWFSSATFMIIFCCAYVFVFAMNWPLFLYYPLHGDFNLGPHVQTGKGPAIAWYGLMADSAIAAFPAAVVIPDRLAHKAFRNYLWVFPVGAMLACAFLLRQFFR
jgi:hypothetical protein